MLQVNSSAVFRYEGHETATIVGRVNRDGVEVLPVGGRLAAGESSAVGRVLRTGAPARIDDWGGVEGDDDIADAIFRVGYRSSAAAPIVVAGELWGAVAIASEEPLPHDAERRLAAFCELVSLAVASAQARADLIASRGAARLGRRRAAAPAGAQPARRRAAASRLGGGEAAGGADAAGGAPGRRRRSWWRSRCTSSASGSRSCARSRAASIPRSSPSRGCRARSTRWRTGCRSTVAIEAPDERLPAPVEATAYYIVSEALTNVVKHSGAAARPGHGACVERRRAAVRGVRRRARRRRRRSEAAGWSGCAIAPRRRAGRCRWSARRAAARS